MDVQEASRKFKEVVGMMTREAVGWIRANPDMNPHVLVVQPKGVAVAVEAPVGIELGILQPNDAGAALVLHLIRLFPKQHPPTVKMVKDSIDAAIKETNSPLSPTPTNTHKTRDSPAKTGKSNDANHQ